MALLPFMNPLALMSPIKKWIFLGVVKLGYGSRTFLYVRNLRPLGLLNMPQVWFVLRKMSRLRIGFSQFSLYWFSDIESEKKNLM